MWVSVVNSYCVRCGWPIWEMVLQWFQIDNSLVGKIPARISNHMSSKVLDEITYRFPNVTGEAAAVWLPASNLQWWQRWSLGMDKWFKFTLYAITYPSWDTSWSISVAGTHCSSCTTMFCLWSARVCPGYKKDVSVLTWYSVGVKHFDGVNITWRVTAYILVGFKPTRV